MKKRLFEAKYKDLTDILRGAMATLAGFLGRTGARVLFLFFAGNFYGAALLGQLAAVIAVFEILVMLGIFGFRRSLMEFLEKAKGDEGRRYNVILTALVVTVTVATTVAAILAYLWDFIGFARPAPHFSLFAFIIPFIALMDVFLTTTRFKRIIRYEVFARSLVEPWTIALSSLAFYFLGMVQEGLLLAYCASLLAAFLFAVWAFGREYEWKKLFKANISFTFIKQMGSFSGPTAIVDAIGVAFRRIDIIFLSLFTPDTMVGIYYGVQNLATVVQKTRHVFDPILSPVVAQTLNQRGSADAGAQLSQVCRWILTLLCLQLALMAFYAAPLLSLIGEGFAVGALALVIVLAAEALEGSFASAELPFVFKKPRLNLALTATGFSLHVAGCLIFIEVLDMGMVGAAVSFLTAITVLNAMRLIAIKQKFDIKLAEAAYLKPIVAGTAAYLVLYYANQGIDLTHALTVPLGIALGLGVYVAAFWMLKPTQADRDFVAYLKTRKKPQGLATVDKDFDQV